MLADLRERMLDQNLTRLFQSAQATERLLAGLDRPESRDALLWQLRADAGMVRQLMLELSKLDRKIELGAADRAGQAHLLIYLAVLEVLMLALLGLSILVFRTTRKLRAAPGVNLPGSSQHRMRS